MNFLSDVFDKESQTAWLCFVNPSDEGTKQMLEENSCRFSSTSWYEKFLGSNYKVRGVSPVEFLNKHLAHENLDSDQARQTTDMKCFLSNNKASWEAAAAAASIVIVIIITITISEMWIVHKLLCFAPINLQSCNRQCNRTVDCNQTVTWANHLKSCPLNPTILTQMRNATWRRSKALGKTNTTNNRSRQLHFTLMDICYLKPAAMFRAPVGGL